MKQRISLSVALVALLAAGVALLVSAPPAQNDWLPRCPVHTWTGLHCPGCGATRCCYELLHGNFGAALRKNILVVAVLPWLIWTLGRHWLHWLRKSPLPPPRRSWWIPLIAVIVFTALRNIPAEPFSWLAPH